MLLPFCRSPQSTYEFEPGPALTAFVPTAALNIHECSHVHACKLFDAPMTGKPVVVDSLTQSFHDASGLGKAELWKLIGSTENCSEHIIAKAICAFTKHFTPSFYDCETFDVTPGAGISATVNKRKVVVGNRR